VAVGRITAALVGVVAVALPVCADAGKRSAAPPPSVHFAVKGDWGYGSPEQAAVTRRMCAAHSRDPFAFVLTTGDNFYRPDGQATPENWDNPEACLIDAGVTWRAAWGNHDLGGDATATRLGSPAHWYSFRVGRGVRVVVLDANRPDDADQIRFLRRTLRAASEPIRIVAFHQPAFTAGFHAPGEVQQRRWVPLFRRYRVQLVLQGHNHAYERIVRDGITYITTGGGGAPTYPCLRPTQGLRVCAPVHHFLAVNIWTRRIVVRAIRPDGSTLERVEIPA
jgi:tartrate-resistant acid phosphatase type 5